MFRSSGFVQTPTLATLLEGYELALKAEAKSKKTTRWYRQKLSYWLEFNRAFDIPDNPLELEPNQLRRFILHLQTLKRDELNPHKPTGSGGLSSYTIRGYVRVVKTFIRWLESEGYLPHDPFAKVRVPKVEKKVIATPSPEQTKRLLASIDRKTVLGLRDYCILVLLLDTGIRSAELRGLRLQEVHLKEGYIKVFGKGAKERIVPIGKQTQKALWDYLHRARGNGEETDYVFLGRNGTPLTESGLAQLVKDRCLAAGITGIRQSPHTMRHTFAISYLRAGGDLFTLQRILGHTTLEMVRNYTNVAFSDVQEAHQKFSPMDRLAR